MASLKNKSLLEDFFEILEVDPDGKKFDKVSRIKARSELYEMDLILDINTDIYPISQGEKISVCLATTLKLDGSDMDTGTPGQQIYDPKIATDGRHETLADKFEYVMFGRIFKYKDSSASGHIKADVYISYGGLMMQLTGDPKRLEDLDLDLHVYLLIKKLSS